MNDQVQEGHEHRREQATVLVLSQSWLDSVTENQLSGYLKVLADLASGPHSGSVEGLESELRKRVPSLGFELAEPSYQRTAEQLAVGCCLQVCAPDGTVLYSDPGVTTEPISERDPGVRGTEDPEHPDRPGYGA